MKNDKNEKRAPSKHEESFAYHEGIGDPDREWEKNMIIDGEEPSKDSEIPHKNKNEKNEDE